MDEQVDVVDEQDRVLRQEMKEFCHDNHIRHRGAAVLAFNAVGELLLEKRSKTKSRNPGKYCIIGGHVGAGEAYLDAARREFFEEIYSTPDGEIDLEELFKIEIDTSSDFEWVVVYRAQVDGLFNPDPVEVEKCFFMKMEMVYSIIKNEPEAFTKSSRIVLEEYRRRFLD